MRVATFLAQASCLLSFATGALAARQLGNLGNVKFTADLWAANITGARNLVFDAVGDLLVIQTDPNSSTNALDGVAGSGLLFPAVVGLVDFGTIDSPRVKTYPIVQNTSLPQGFIPNHGIEIIDNYLYLSNETSIWRWPYRAGQRRSVSASSAQLFTSNMPWKVQGLGHTRTLLYRAQDDKFFVADGLDLNIDYTDNRSDIRYFPVRSAPIPAGGWDWYSRPIWALGLRNAVGLAIQPVTNWLWETDQGIDDLYREDLGGDIHNDNPPDELNLLDNWSKPETVNAQKPYHFGFPYCWTEGNITNASSTVGPHKAGDQWAQYLNRSDYTDAYCKDPKKNIKPLALVQAHAAPLGIQFFNGTGCVNTPNCNSKRNPFTCNYTGQLFFTAHGADNRDRSVGHFFGTFPFSSKTKLPSRPLAAPPANYDELYGETDQTLCTVSFSGQNCWRPTMIKFDRFGRLFITENNRGEVWRLSIDGTA
ncbi:unnamed protein product [Tilletia controversa]|uniref:Pyrroloquinoline quinone-dependent pyranose dehydrogenase beta-propeller domain-containing protein n=3 Tax=Tilletia TaxID=13289 RepID=A0A8X7N0U3_9BASI|nr:hypothetical protein CF336_g855 [Tilletia laevis]KAE8204334.1 hypothetical protein CF328_g1139 [Tilletia controversa]KAE8265349.1 hypothetical protein A4X03_0g329 [Tilletia caries]KAE8208032.1 hypothetical protein CF335_g705 [Tilletia laevis]KAE8254463.1 hypothetical protein A4X06_0g880 [Tilletia controversa]